MGLLALYALLRDASGSILLIKRRDSILWGLPGGEVRGFDQKEEQLAALCGRQVGIRPEFAGAFEEFTLAGMRVAVGSDEVNGPRAAARGKVQAVSWMKPGNPPGELEPTARLAIALYNSRTRTKQIVDSRLPELVTYKSEPRPFWGPVG